jgi:hypothetical protein
MGIRQCSIEIDQCLVSRPDEVEDRFIGLAVFMDSDPNTGYREIPDVKPV